MNSLRLMITAATLIVLSGVADADAESKIPQQTAEDVVSEYFRLLGDKDIEAMDILFLRIPAIESNPDDWLDLIELVAQKVEDEQLAWDVICSKELSETAVVIVNQTLKHGKKHGDPDAVYLVKENDRWLIAPDLIAHRATREIESVLGNTYRSERFMLKRWALGEIRGLTSECRDQPAPD